MGTEFSPQSQHDSMIDNVHFCIARNLQYKHLSLAAEREFQLLCSLRRQIETHAPEMHGTYSHKDDPCVGCDDGSRWTNCSVVTEAQQVLGSIT